MIEVIDREPLGNGKNNKVTFSLPTTISTVQQLVALLNAGVYADVFANNEQGANAGAAKVGTAVNRALFLSIREGSLQDVSLLDDICICAGSVAVTAGWTAIKFPRVFRTVPQVVCSVVRASSDTTAYIPIVANVTTEGFYAGIDRPAINQQTVPVTVSGTVSVTGSGTWSGTKTLTGANTMTGSITVPPTATSQWVAGTLAYIACEDLGIVLR